jgi:hypothetical protein
MPASVIEDCRQQLTVAATPSRRFRDTLAFATLRRCAAELQIQMVASPRNHLYLD